MSEAKLSRTVVVANPNGLHMRPASLIAKLANQFQSKIELVRGQERVDGKSMLEIVTLVAEHGTNLTIEASGPDAEAAVEALAVLFASQFADVEEETSKDP
ncbi:MAG TPA: HPr family phosphocarrier protein [Pirellulales bacterium]|nr:HPr family phosphocarrier protein [Pirellulales bacterium]